MTGQRQTLGGNLETRTIQLMTGDSGVKRMQAGHDCCIHARARQREHA